jgi:hypothetical protein
MQLPDSRRFAKAFGHPVGAFRGVLDLCPLVLCCLFLSETPSGDILVRLPHSSLEELSERTFGAVLHAGHPECASSELDLSPESFRSLALQRPHDPAEAFVPVGVEPAGQGDREGVTGINHRRAPIDSAFVHRPAMLTKP